MKADASLSAASDTPVSIPSPFSMIDQIVGGEVAGGARRVRAAAEPAGRRVEGRDAEGQRRQDVGERRAARVVEVQRHLRSAGVAASTASSTRGTCAGMRDADRVADGHLEDAEVQQSRRETGDDPPARPSPSYGQPNAVER